VAINYPSFSADTFPPWWVVAVNQLEAVACDRRQVIVRHLAVSGEKGNYPEFRNNLKTVEARVYWRDSSVSPSGAGYHYIRNADTYMEVGNALGRAMAELLE
jgi:hypothetical protein